MSSLDVVVLTTLVVYQGLALRIWDIFSKLPIFKNPPIISMEMYLPCVGTLTEVYGVPVGFLGRSLNGELLCHFWIA